MNSSNACLRLRIDMGPADQVGLVRPTLLRRFMIDYGPQIPALAGMEKIPLPPPTSTRQDIAAWKLSAFLLTITEYQAQRERDPMMKQAMEEGRRS